MSETAETTIDEDSTPSMEEQEKKRRLIYIQVVVDGSALTANNPAGQDTAQGDQSQGRAPVFMVTDALGSRGNGTNALQLHAVRGTRILWNLKCLQPSQWAVSFEQFQIVRDPGHVFRWLDPALVNGFYRAKVRHQGIVNLFSRIVLYNVLGERQVTYNWRPSIQVQSGLAPVPPG